MKVLLVDDHALFREGMALLLRPLVDPLELHAAGTCEAALAVLAAHGPFDLVIIDLSMPGMSGLDGIRHLKLTLPELPVVALSSSDDRSTVLQALDAGAMGFIPKSSTPAVMIAALRLILAKGIYLPSSVFLTASGPDEPARAVTAPTAAAVPSPASLKRPADLGLTARQADVLYRLLQGKSGKLIGRELDLAPSTVKAHTSAVLRALNVTTRTQAVVAAGRIGLRFDDDHEGR